ncbi:MAG: hypothetical protein ACOC6S_03480 [Chloroflexota bacterium]
MSEWATENSIPDELKSNLVDSAVKLAPPVKHRVKSGSNDIYEYLRGGRDQPKLYETLGDNFFNSQFLYSVVAEVDMASLIDAMLYSQGVPTRLNEPLVEAFREFEPAMEEGLSEASGPVFEYLLKDRESVDVAHTLRASIPSGFPGALLEGLEIFEVSSGMIRSGVEQYLPEEVEDLSRRQLDSAFAEIEPAVREQLIKSADPILDYLLNQREGVSVSVSLEPLKEGLREPLREAFMNSPPPQFADLPPEVLREHFEEYYRGLIATMPRTAEIDENWPVMDDVKELTESILTECQRSLADARDGLAEGIANAERGLAELRGDVSEFQLWYKVLIGVMVLLILAIVLIYRTVKGATRSLGIVFLLYGIVGLAGVILARSIATTHLTGLDLPSAVQSLPVQLLNDGTSPLQVLSIGMIVVGIILVLVSIFYPFRRGYLQSSELRT